MLFQTPAAWPGTVNAARPAFGSSGGRGSIGPDPLGEGLGDFLGVPRGPDARAVDAAAAAVEVDAVDHQVEVLFPIVDQVVAEQDLAEAGAVGLHVRVALVALDGGACRRRSCCARNWPAPPRRRRRRRDRSQIASGGMPASDERRRHAIRRPRLLRAGLEHQADLHRNDRQPQRVHAGRIRRQHHAQRRRLGLIADHHAAAFHAVAARQDRQVAGRASGRRAFDPCA